MQKYRLLFIVVALLVSLPCFAKKPVLLRGTWGKGLKSIVPNLPIQAWVEDNGKDLLLEFSAKLGTVQVTVSNQKGEIVYRQSVEADAMSSVMVPLDKPMEEGYLLSITDGKNVVYGNIIIY